MGGGAINVLVLLGGLLFGGGGIAAFYTARTQRRTAARGDNREDRRLDLEQSESTNKILAAALDFYKEECDDLRARIRQLEEGHHHEP